MEHPTGQFIAVVLAARILRYFGEAWLGINVGRDSASFLTGHAWQFVSAAAVLFAALYGFVLLRGRARAG